MRSTEVKRYRLVSHTFCLLLLISTMLLYSDLQKLNDVHIKKTPKQKNPAPKPNTPISAISTGIRICIKY